MTNELCVFYISARSQRETEVERGDGLEGTTGYENHGCYECNGHNHDCDNHYPHV